MRHVFLGISVLLCACNVFGSVQETDPPDAGSDLGDATEDMRLQTPDVRSDGDMAGTEPDASTQADADAGTSFPGPVFFVSTDGDDTGDGSINNPWATFARATSELQPNETLLIRGGTYAEQLAPTTSGAIDAPVYIRGYQDEQVALSADIAISIVGQSYIQLSDVTVLSPTTQYGLVEDSQSITLDRMTFRHESFDPALFDHDGFLAVDSDDVAITNSTFELLGSGSHQIVFTRASGYIAHNTFEESGSPTIELEASSKALIFDNEFHNPRAKCVLAYGLSETSVINNRLFGCSNNGSGEAIHLEAPPFALIRGNEITGSGTGILIDAGANGDMFSNIRVAHNTISLNDVSGITITDTTFSGVDIQDIIVTNNIIFRNGDPAAGVFTQAFVSDFESVNYGDVVFRSNLWSNTSQTECANALALGTLDSTFCPIEIVGRANADIPWFEQNEPTEFRLNSEDDPRFSLLRFYPEPSDFALLAGSPAIDTAIPLAQVTNTGNGRRIPVSDPTYFTGVNAAGYPGDTVLIGAETVSIVFVDHAFSEIEVDRDVDFTNGDGIFFPFQGQGPNIGAVESN